MVFGGGTQSIPSLLRQEERHDTVLESILFKEIKRMFRALILFVAILSCYQALGETPSRHRSSIVIENRVLATVRDQTITVVDVVKKLDMIFRQQFPQYRHVPEARYEFYRANWRRVFEELVDRQLIVSFSEEKHFGVTNGDVRQELEETFGPHVMMNLYEEGLSLHDAHEMMKADILLRRAMSFYVHSPVLAAITPEVLRGAYRGRIEEVKQKQGWIWRAVTVKSKKGDCPRDVADAVWNLLEREHQTLDGITSGLPEGIEVSISQVFRSEQKDVAPNVRQILEKLPVRSFSDPQLWNSRSDPHQSWRCYIVDERFEQSVPTFFELEPALRQEIASPEITKRTLEFFDDLRKQYHVKHVFSSEQLVAFEPFQLKPSGSEQKLVAEKSGS